MNSVNEALRARMLRVSDLQDGIKIAAEKIAAGMNGRAITDSVLRRHVKTEMERKEDEGQ